MKNVKLGDEQKRGDEQKKAETQFLLSNNPYYVFHRPESDSEQQYDGHMPQPVSGQKIADDSTCCGCALF